MKRIIFCFDGTWNRLDAKSITNVVHTARNIKSIDSDGVPQLIYYDEGVGTKKGEKYRGGIFGKGLLENIADAYKFLVFNYEIGDEIYLFGFSRGAFSARSFAGLIFHCGIIERHQIKRIPEALYRYRKRQKDDDYMRPELRDFRLECSPNLCVNEEEFEWRLNKETCDVNLKISDKTIFDDFLSDTHILRIKYIGVWDTVGALGVPKTMSIASFVNRRHQFHDCNLSDFVASARHAVAIDERRRSFEPTLWENIDPMNESLGYNSASDDAPYQQQWFPGVHGAVGGGGDHTGLSDEALEWIWSGAKNLGLEFSDNKHSTIYDIKPDYKDYINNMLPPKGLALKSRMKSLLSKSSRKKNSPVALHHLSTSTKYRWKEDGDSLKPKGPYRPKETLDNVADVLDEWDFSKTAVLPVEKSSSKISSASDKIAELETKSARVTYMVQKDDTLFDIAESFYSDGELFPSIFEANQPILTHPDRIYPGQVLVIPALKA